VRVSTNGGAAFAAVAPLSADSTTNGPPPAVAIGDGVIYVVYFLDDSHIDMRRSLDNGVTWQAAVQLASDAYPNDDTRAVTISASATHALFAYSAKSGSEKWVRYRRTTNQGAQWSTTTDLSSPSGFPSYHPVINLNSGIGRVTFFACGNANCTHSAAAYRQTSNGTSWTAAVTVSATGPNWADAEGVGYSGKVIVLYDAQHGTAFGDCGCDTYVRTK
jgi:hypothetical protein